MSKMGEIALELDEMAADHVAAFIETGVRPEYTGPFQTYYNDKFKEFLSEYEGWVDERDERRGAFDLEVVGFNPQPEDEDRDWDAMADEYYGMTHYEEGAPLPGSLRDIEA